MSLEKTGSRWINEKDLPTEFARLQALENWADPVTIQILSKRPIESSSRCLEMGAGAGSIAYWMSERCPAGRVVAADIDARFLDSSKAPNLEVATLDLGQADFPPGSFDLIHARMVLSHIPARENILERAVQWLAPGGTILVEDYYFLPVEHALSEPQRLFFNIFLRSLVAQGSDPHWGRRVPGHLARLGLDEIRVSTTPVVMGTGDPSGVLWNMTFEQYLPLVLERGLVTPAQIAAYKGAPKSQVVDVPCVLLSASGRRP